MACNRYRPVFQGWGVMATGWYGLLDIIQTGREERRVWRERIPVACPRDGEPLTGGPSGEWFCKFDGWVWDGSVEDAQP